LTQRMEGMMSVGTLRAFLLLLWWCLGAAAAAGSEALFLRESVACEAMELRRELLKMSEKTMWGEEMGP